MKAVARGTLRGCDRSFAITLPVVAGASRMSKSSPEHKKEDADHAGNRGIAATAPRD
jgi:hypothetical protein